MRDTSLRVPSGMSGTVIAAKVFSREGADPDSRTIAIQEEEAQKLRKDEKVRIAIIKDSAVRKIIKIVGDATIAEDLLDKQGSVLLKSGERVKKDLLEKIDITAWYDLTVADAEANSLLSKVLDNLKEKINQIRYMTDEQLTKLGKGDELPPTVIKMVKVYVAIKRKLQVGDKMAGRHGNKGVVSRILPEEDMPYTADGRPVDVVLNPLGVPSRMNVGQILETHLGWAAKNLGEKLNQVMENAFNRETLEQMCREIWNTDDCKNDIEDFLMGCSDEDLKVFIRKYKEGVHFANPVFDGVVESQIHEALELAGCDSDGQVDLYDGRTGISFIIG